MRREVSESASPSLLPEGQEDFLTLPDDKDGRLGRRRPSSQISLNALPTRSRYTRLRTSLQFFNV